MKSPTFRHPWQNIKRMAFHVSICTDIHFILEKENVNVQQLQTVFDADLLNF